ncbi:MAG: hypothetical protein J6V27_02740 [Alistipes sp.]|nr:hypothetical protein [Alistipes sp.]
MKNFICFVIGILVGVIGFIVGAGEYAKYQERQELANQIVVDDIVGTYSDYECQWLGYGSPNPIGFPEGEWVVVITKLSDTKFKIDGSISTTGEINNGEITIQPTKYKNGREHIDITYTLYKVKDDDTRMCDLSMHVKCVGEAIYKKEELVVRNGSIERKFKSELKLYDKNIFLDLRKVADYDYRRK